jgi:hypothetical protein
MKLMTRKKRELMEKTEVSQVMIKTTPTWSMKGKSSIGSSNAEFPPSSAPAVSSLLVLFPAAAAVAAMSPTSASELEAAGTVGTIFYSPQTPTPVPLLHTPLKTLQMQKTHHIELGKKCHRKQKKKKGTTLSCEIH